MQVGGTIYPDGMIGTRETQPPAAKVPKLRRSGAIKIGRPINVERYRDHGDTHMVLRQITDELMFEIRELTGQDYRDRYAGKTAETEPTTVARVATMGTEQPDLVGATTDR